MDESPCLHTTAYLPGDLLENLLVTDLTVEGKGLARHEGMVVFLDRGLPGTRVSARVVAVKKRLITAVVTEVLQRSPYTVECWCPHAEECGACLWQHFSPDSALEWKRRHIRESFARIGKFADIEIAPVQPSPKLKEYRNKMVYAFARDTNSSLVLGLRRRKEHSIVEVTACGIQSPPAMDILAYVRTTAKRLGLTASTRTAAGQGRGYLRFLIIHTPEYKPEGKQQVLVECITGNNHEEATAAAGGNTGRQHTVNNAEAVRLLGEELMEKFRLTGFVHSERKQSSDVAQGERLVQQIGAAMYEERFGHLVLRVPYNAFLQTNTEAATLLYDLIARESHLDGTQTVWDIFSGIGSIALYLAPRARKIYGLDIQAEAVIAARNNSMALGLSHCSFHQGELTPERIHSIPKPDLIILDPPRNGLNGPTLEALRQTSAPRMLYVSCDAGTQARDLAYLAQSWRPIKSVPIDMFPNTPHMENLVVLESSGF